MIVAGVFFPRLFLDLLRDLDLGFGEPAMELVEVENSSMELESLPA